MKTVRLSIVVALILALAAACVVAAPGAKAKVKPGDKQAQWWGGPPGPRPYVAGTVENVSPTSIAVKTAKQGVKPFVVNEQTRIRVRGQKTTINDVRVGDRVGVHFQLQGNNVPLALGIVVPKPSVKGKILGIEGSVIILQTEGGEKRVAFSDKTRIASHGYRGTPADLRPGYVIVAGGDVTDGVLLATQIQFFPMMAKGTVVARDGDVITVKAVKQMTYVVAASTATVVTVRPRVGPNKKGTLADIQVGMPANIGFHSNPNGPGQLLWIDLLTGM